MNFNDYCWCFEGGVGASAPAHQGHRGFIGLVRGERHAPHIRVETVKSKLLGSYVYGFDEVSFNHVAVYLAEPEA